MVYKIPKLIDINARSRLIRSFKKLLIIGRCVEVEHPEFLEVFRDYGKVSVCLEEEHMNMVGFKLAGVLARGDFEEISVLTVDGSPHCTQLHYMVEEVCRVVKNLPRRRHYVIEGGKLIEIPGKAVKVSRYLSKVAKLLDSEKDSNT